MSSVQDQLIARLRAAGLDLPEGTRLVRTHAPRSDVAAGAWSWRAENAAGYPLYWGGGTVGSQYSMTQLVRADGIELDEQDRYGDVNVDPVRQLS